jgi:23S rRNA pseudouridine2604 synthase
MTPHAFKIHLMTNPVRLAKRLAELVVCSRREAELYIAGGWVTVDGQVVEEPQFMVSEQKVELHPEAKLTPLEPVTILWHQPPSPQSSPASGGGDKREILSSVPEFTPPLLCAATRAADDHSGIRILKQHFVRLTQCLPLQAHASGLAVFTQDYRVSRKLSDDAATIEQEYVVEVAGELIDDGLKLLNHGLSYNGKALSPIKVSWQNETRLRFALKGVQPGQIVHMCNSVGLQVLGMKRLRIGRVSMAKLQSGQWRYLLGYERF